MSDAAPIAANRTLRRLPNAAYRQREYLTEAEVERLIEAARRRGRKRSKRRCGDLASVSTRPSRGRAVSASLVADRLETRKAARQPRQGRD